MGRARRPDGARGAPGLISDSGGGAKGTHGVPDAGRRRRARTTGRTAAARAAAPSVSASISVCSSASVRRAVAISSWALGRRAVRRGCAIRGADERGVRLARCARHAPRAGGGPPSRRSGRHRSCTSQSRTRDAHDDRCTGSPGPRRWAVRSGACTPMADVVAAEPRRHRRVAVGTCATPTAPSRRWATGRCPERRRRRCRRPPPRTAAGRAGCGGAGAARRDRPLPGTRRGRRP